MIDDLDLLQRIKAHAASEADELPPVVKQAEIDEAQTRLGFQIPSLLAAVYREVGNGEFGPNDGLLRLSGGSDGNSMVDEYLARRASNVSSAWAWPEGVLPILDWGCAMYACVDCRSKDNPVLLFEPNPGEPDQAWYVDAPSLKEWFVHYVEDTGWWIKAENGEEPDEMPQWSNWETRIRS